jgi:hypothetical protein
MVFVAIISGINLLAKKELYSRKGEKLLTLYNNGQEKTTIY